MESLDVLIPSLPSPAWRLLLEMLQGDRGFSQAVVPYFHADGCVTLCISRRPLHVPHGMLAAASGQSEGERNVKIVCGKDDQIAATSTLVKATAVKQLRAAVAEN